MCVFNTLYILFKYMINYVISSLCLYLTFNTLSFYTHRLHTLLFYTLLFFIFCILLNTLLGYTPVYCHFLFCVFKASSKSRPDESDVPQKKRILPAWMMTSAKGTVPWQQIQCLFTLTHPPSVRMTQLSLLLRNKVEKMERELVPIHLSNQLQRCDSLSPDILLILSYSRAPCSSQKYR